MSYNSTRQSIVETVHLLLLILKRWEFKKITKHGVTIITNIVRFYPNVNHKYLINKSGGNWPIAVTKNQNRSVITVKS